MANGETKMLNTQPGCAAGVDHARRIIHLEESNMKQWDVIEKIRNRLPHWATLLIALLVGAVGWLVKAI